MSNVDYEYDGEGVHVTADLVLTSQCCGSEVATCTAEDTFAVDFKHQGDCELEPDVYETSMALTDRFQHDIGKKGQPLKSGTTFYGAEVAFIVKCKCGAEVEAEGVVEADSRDFEEAR